MTRPGGREDTPRLPRKPVSFAYRLGIALVSVWMLLLPVVYVALVLGLGVGLVGYVIWQMSSPRDEFIGFIGLVLPPLFGGILLFFTLKPLLARRGAWNLSRPVDPDKETELLELIREVATAIGAPMPTEIHVDLQVNASASFRRGILSFLGSDLRLTIGAPLLAVLSRRQLAGVLAHELGHFAQGSGMRLTHVIQSVNRWLARVVYERDAWDEVLAELSRVGQIYTMIFLLLARGAVWLVRRILWLLMLAAHGVSAYLMRQMEYDADRSQVGYAGSETFTRTMDTMAVLDLVWLSAEPDVQVLWSDARLPDRLVEYVSLKAEGLSESERDEILSLRDEASTGPFDTHPSPKDRVAAAERMGEPGIIKESGAAAELLTDLEEFDRQLTRDLYQSIFGYRFRDDLLRPAADLRADLDALGETFDAGARFFNGWERFARPLPPFGEGEAPGSVAGTVESLASLRDSVPSLTGAWHDSIDDFEEALHRKTALRLIESLLDVGYEVDMADFGFPGEAVAGREDLAVRNAEREERILALLEPAEAALRERLHLALSLFDHEDVRERIEGGERLREERDQLLPAARCLAGEVDGIVELSCDSSVLQGLLVQLQGDPRRTKLHREAEEVAYRLRRALVELSARLRAVAYPFLHGEEEATLGSVLLPRIPGGRDGAAVLGVALELFGDFFALNVRVHYRLGTLAELAEGAVELAPLPRNEEGAAEDPPPPR